VVLTGRSPDHFHSNAMVRILRSGAFVLLHGKRNLPVFLKDYFTNRYFFYNLLFMAKNPEHRDLFPGALEIMILQSLRLKPMHGYALVKHIKQVSDELLQVEEGSLYPALQRMLREGLLKSEMGTSAKGRPTRIYRLTDAGIRHLEREVVSFGKMFDGITRVLTVAKA
jgi:PadR family transcriptional regulator, regulatory protein PadR